MKRFADIWLKALMVIWALALVGFIVWSLVASFDHNLSSGLIIAGIYIVVWITVVCLVVKDG